MGLFSFSSRHAKSEEEFTFILHLEKRHHTNPLSYLLHWCSCSCTPPGWFRWVPYFFLECLPGKTYKLSFFNTCWKSIFCSKWQLSDVHLSNNVVQWRNPSLGIIFALTMVSDKSWALSLFQWLVDISVRIQRAPRRGSESVSAEKHYLSQLLNSLHHSFATRLIPPLNSKKSTLPSGRVRQFTFQFDA